MSCKKNMRYRWAAPDGRRGRWRNTVQGAIISAVSTANSNSGSGVRVSVDARIAEILWPDAYANGWRIESADKGDRQ